MYLAVLNRRQLTGDTNLKIHKNNNSNNNNL